MKKSALIRILALVLALSMILLVGCAKETTDEETTTVDPTEETAEVVQETTETTGDVIEIELWHCNSGDIGAFVEEMVASFNDSQDAYHATATYAGTYAEALAKLQATDPSNYPDVFAQDTEGAYTVYVAPSMYVPLQSFIDAEGYEMRTFMGNLTSAYSNTDGEWQSMPMGNTAGGFWYNAEVLEANGVDPQADLSSYDAILEVCRKLKDAGYDHPFHFAATSSYLTMPMTAEGIQYVDNNNGKDGVPTKGLFTEGACYDATVKLFDFLQTMTEEGLMVPYGTTYADARDLFANGELVIYSDFISGYSACTNAVNGAFDYGFRIFGTISADAECVGSCAGGGCMFVANTGNEAKEQGAWELLKWFMQTENVVGYATSSGYVPTTVEGFESAEYQEFVETSFPTAKYAIDVQRATGGDVYNAWLPMFNDFHAICKEYFDYACNNLDQTPEEITAKFAARVDECIELYRLQYGLD